MRGALTAGVQARRWRPREPVLRFGAGVSPGRRRLSAARNGATGSRTACGRTRRFEPELPLGHCATTPVLGSQLGDRLGEGPQMPARIDDAVLPLAER
jgi:hypothetical protein